MARNVLDTINELNSIISLLRQCHELLKFLKEFEATNSVISQEAKAFKPAIDDFLKSVYIRLRFEKPDVIREVTCLVCGATE